MFGSVSNRKRQIGKYFLGLEKFIECYGANVSDKHYVETRYTNILGRLPDADKINYWVGRIINGVKTRAEALLKFAESNSSIL